MIDLDQDPVPPPAPRGVMKLRDYQRDCLEALRKSWPQFSRNLCVLAGGCGKCLGKGTPVMLFSGKIKPVEEIIVGDLLMGPDSKPRKVTSICRGRENLYRVNPVKGDSYVVNESHILSLKTTGTRAINHLGQRLKGHGIIVNMSVTDYLRASRHLRRSTVGWRAKIDFPSTAIHHDLPPYILGVWLGDGDSRGRGFATTDPEIESELRSYAQSLAHGIRKEVIPGKCPMFHVSTFERGRGRGLRHNRFRRSLHDLNLLQNKHVPDCYRINSKNVRLEVLAGLLDTDGSLHGNCYDFISKSERLADDICFLARSLGLAAYKSPQFKICVNNGVRGLYYRVSISGNTDMIPCRIARKKAGPRRQKKNVLTTGISVNPIGLGEYFGFELNGPDRLFVLGDFTVTHNTVLFSNVTKEEVDAGGRVLILAHTDELLEQAMDKLMKSTGLEADKEKAEDHASPYAPIVIASVQTLSREGRLTAYPDDHFTLVIVDEAHRSLSPSYLRVLNYFHFGQESLVEGWTPPLPGEPYRPKAKVVGWTATNSRGDKRSLGEFYQSIPFEYGLLEAVRDGYLVKPIVKNIPLKIDMRGVKMSRSGGQGGDLDLGEVSARITPFLRQIAKEIALHGAKLKMVVFMPSIDTAKLLSEALREYDLNAFFVSGACPDRESKIERFREFKGPIILCNALLVVEGFDVPDINGVCVLRPTKIWSFYVQANVRGTRTLPGVIDGLERREDRLAAIAASEKPFFTILDFLWLSDRMDLVTPFDLVASKQGVKEKMAEAATGAESVDLLAVEAQAERDFLAALEKESRRHARKAARVIDPIAWAVSLGDVTLAGWEPMTPWDELPPTKDQLAFLAKQHIDTSKVRFRGLATKMILRIIQRLKSGLASYEQMTFLHKLGISEKDTVLMTRQQASALIDATLAEKKARRQATAGESPASPAS